jgi:hypothetical protein
MVTSAAFLENTPMRLVAEAWQETQLERVEELQNNEPTTNSTQTSPKIRASSTRPTFLAAAKGTNS